MARKRRSPPSSDGAGPSRPPKIAKSTSLSMDPTSEFSEVATGRSPLELEAVIRKLIHKIKELETEVNELKEKSNILQNHTDTNQTRSEQVDHGRYEIRIIGAIKKRVYTGSKVEGQDGKLLKVAIYYNGEKLTSEPFASAEFEILVMKGDFCEKGSWTAETFQGSLVEAREEVGSILKINSVSKFASGEAVLDGLIFIDNSSWVKGKKWRLGIRLKESNGVRIVEAISNCFRVLDRHQKASEKPHPPLLTHGVECLEKVGKKRALDLKKKKICTVKDFLQLFHSNQSRLLKILGMNSELDQSWKTMIGHAKECDVGSNLYSYRKDNRKTQSMLFFDSVYNLVGAEFGNRYRSFDELKDSRKTLVNKQKKGFYKDIKMGIFTADFEMVNGQPVPIEHDSTSISADDDARLNDENSSEVQEQESEGSVQEPYQNAQSISADFEMVNGQPVPIEHDFTSISTDDAQQNDQTAGALDRQPADNTCSLSYDVVSDIGRNADQNIVSDHNAGENYDSTQEFSDENFSQVQEQESAFVALNSTVEINSTSAHENMSVEQPYQGENMEGLSDLEDMTLFSNEDYDAMLRTIVDCLSQQRNPVKEWSILHLVARFVLYIRRRSGEHRNACMAETVI